MVNVTVPQLTSAAKFLPLGHLAIFITVKRQRAGMEKQHYHHRKTQFISYPITCSHLRAQVDQFGPRIEAGSSTIASNPIQSKCLCGKYMSGLLEACDAESEIPD